MQAQIITNENKDLFNNYIESVPKGHIFQLYEWGELKATTGWEPIRFIVKDEEEIKGALTILKRSIPVINKNIFYAPRGPVCNIQDYEVMDFIWKTTRELAKEHGAIFLKIDPDITVDNKAFHEYLVNSKFVYNETGKNFEGIQPKFVSKLGLDKPLDDILMDMVSKTRYNIRYAGRKGVKIIEDCTREDLRRFYDILEVTADRDEFMVRSYEYFENIWDILGKVGYAKLFMAEYEGQYLAGAIAMKCGDKVWYIYGASSNQHRNKQPNYLLQWTMIKWAHEMGCSVYDFRGISGDLSEDNPLYGLYRFKKGFNGDFTEYVGEYDLVFSQIYYKLWTQAMPAAKKMRSKLLQIFNQ